MIIDLNKLTKAGFRVTVDNEEGKVYVEIAKPCIDQSLINTLRARVNDPMLKDLIVETTLRTVERAQVIEMMDF